MQRRMMLSAYLDGEVPERFIAEIDVELANDPSIQREYEVLLALRTRIIADPTPGSCQRLFLARQISVERGAFLVAEAAGGRASGGRNDAGDFPGARLQRREAARRTAAGTEHESGDEEQGSAHGPDP